MRAVAGAAMIVLGLAGCATAPESAPGPGPVSDTAPSPRAGSNAADPAAIAAAVADPARPEADVARDALRKPAEMVSFAGVAPESRVAEFIPGGGYYTRILARTVGPRGHVYAIVPAAMAQRPGAMDAINAIAAAYPNVMVVTADLTNFTLPAQVDVAWTSENYHDLHNGPAPNVAGFNRAVFAALRPGGTFYVEDHSAPGTGTQATSTLHRIDPETVVAEVTAAGFRLEARSQALANPQDRHDAAVFDPSIRGRTDRFALRFRKPE